ncbi:RAB1A [Mytilus edulis]|uniref:RAB1A n=1 Tax=Mytilus edulis TaxID=6550 RepID=A0A8S3QYI6_MYTED|nr:RAB1A [Mytilus edulis]
MSNCYKNLSISSWNVHGLGDKLKDELFIENLKGDINILLETWKGESKEFKLEGHCIISKSRKKKKARRYSGGIIVTIKKPYFKGITYLKEATTSPNRLWLKLNKNFFGFVHDIYLCALYIPPFSSSHYDNDLDFLENEISTFSMNGQIVLIGDLNARTGQRADFIVNDSDHINNFDGFDLLPENYITDSEINRNNQDTSVNTVGTKLLDLCLSSRLRLLNGRFLGDSLGYYTYMSSSGFSTVDYAVVSERLLSSVKYFKTNDFTYLSDHVQITLYMKCSINIDKEISLEEKGWHWIKSCKWSENSKLKLIDALLTENVKNEIIEFEMVNYEENQVGVDEATEKLTKILDNISSLSCKATPKTKRRKKKRKFKQVWSDNVIYETKRQINKIGNKIRNNPNNNSLKQKFFELKKNLKKMVKQKKYEYKQKLYNCLTTNMGHVREERFRCISTGYYRKSHAALVVYDVTSTESLNNCFRWMNDISMYSGQDIPKILLETNAKDGRNVDDALYTLAQELSRTYTEPKDNSFDSIKLDSLTDNTASWWGCCGY